MIVFAWQKAGLGVENLHGQMVCLSGAKLLPAPRHSRVGEFPASAQPLHYRAQRMNMLDLIKATITCGISAFLIYTFPIISQVVIIGLLTLLWLSYAHKTLTAFRRR